MPTVRDLIRLGPRVEERLTLPRDRAHATTLNYVLTQGAVRAWEAINHQILAASGAFLWIEGLAGTGKTHFLNYALEIDRQTRLSASPDSGRKLQLAIDLDHVNRAQELGPLLLELFAQELAGNRRSAMLWRRMHGAEAFAVALSELRRTGVEAITIAIDFGVKDPDLKRSGIEMLGEIAAESTRPRVILIAASRASPSPSAITFEVAPRDADEKILVALGRARRLKEKSASVVREYYEDEETGRFDPAEIFPFELPALRALSAIVPRGGIPSLARMVREILGTAPDNPLLSRRSLIGVSDLMQAPAFLRVVEARLGETGRTAFGLALAAAAAFDEPERVVALEVVELLALDYLCGPPLSRGRMKWPSRVMKAAAMPACPAPRTIADFLIELSRLSNDVIHFDGTYARFDPAAMGADTLAVSAFNRAIELILLFDSTLTMAETSPEVDTKLNRLGDGMARMAREASEALETLSAFFDTEPSGMPSSWRLTLDDFITLAGGGPTALLAASEGSSVTDLPQLVAEYNRLSRIAAMVPRLRMMRDFMDQTGLQTEPSVAAAEDRRMAALEVERALLTTELRAGQVLANGTGFEALEARFQKFKWNYARCYVRAHASWRDKMVRLDRVLADVRAHLEALTLLDALAELGEPVARTYQAKLAGIAAAVSVCELSAPLAPEITPLCPSCRFTLGTPSPRNELEELFALVKDALKGKLTALSRSAVMRLIHKHDLGDRLEGFLKIVQAAETDALVRVIDERLIAYLSRLLREETTPRADGLASLSTSSARRRLLSPPQPPNPRRSMKRVPR